MANLLIVEDDPDINRLLCKILSKPEYHITAAFSGSEAKLLLNQQPFDLVLLDLMLPGLSGEELLSEIRKNATMPVIVISAKGREDKLNVLHCGADDFISKPFDVDEVEVRVEAQLRRYIRFSVPPAGQILHCGELTLDPDNHLARINHQELPLTAREFAILELLMRYPKKVFTRANLFETIWGEDYIGDDNTVNVHISNLRAKLSKISPNTEYIKTIWGIGFKLADDL